MLTHYTDAEIRQKLKELVVIADSREQVHQHIISWLDKHNIQHKSRALETGDYSVMLGDTTFEDEVVVERKANLDEIAGNFTAGRERFEREMIRAKAGGIKVFLIVERYFPAQLSVRSETAELRRNPPVLAGQVQPDYHLL